MLNRYDLLRRCLESIDFPVGHLLIIDNGENFRGRMPKPESVQKMTWLDMPSNFGVAASWNLAIKSFYRDPIWFFASNDMAFKPGGMKTLFEHATPDGLTLSEMFPHFHTFAVGEEVVRRVGLFDENIFPAFEEDVEMLNRVAAADLPIVRAPIDAIHDNSSTIGSDDGFRRANDFTHPENRNYREKKEAGLIPLTEPAWRIDRWRRQGWR